MKLGKKLMPRLAEGPGRLYAVPPWFRAEIANALPGLEAADPREARSFWRLLSLLLFKWDWSVNGDDAAASDRKVAILAAECAWCEDKLKRYVSGHRYVMRPFLERFEKTVGLSLGTQSPRIPVRSRRGCPYLFAPSWPRGVQQAVEQLFQRGAGITDDLVTLDTDEPWSRTEAVAHREALRRHWTDQVQRDGTLCAEAKRIVTYLNRLPAERFANLIDGGITQAYCEAQKRIASYEMGPRVWMDLAAIAQCPVPLYLPSHVVPRRTDRVYEAPPAVSALKRELRPLLLPLAIELDLSACQLALAAAWWPIEPIQELLSREPDVWAALLARLGLPDHGRSRLKELVYASIFGRQRRNLAADAYRDGLVGSREEAITLLDHPLLVSLRGAYRRRSREMVSAARACEPEADPLLDDHRLVTPLGTTIPLPLKGTSVRNVSSALAQEMQAFEVWLIDSVYAAAEKQDALFVVVLHQHDGVSILPKTLWQQLRDGPVQDSSSVPYEQWVAAVDQVYQAIEERVSQVSDYVNRRVYTRPKIAYAPSTLPGPVDPYALAQEFVCSLRTSPEVVSSGYVLSGQLHPLWLQWCRYRYHCSSLVGKHRLNKIMCINGHEFARICRKGDRYRVWML